MADTKKSRISARKSPRQARSNDLVAAVLDAAVQVLRKEGAQRFTTARVAERAGVSVGSIYQYFPNKAAILFRVQAEEWRRNTAMLAGILNDTSHPVETRLRSMAHAFLQSECDEAEVRLALADAAPLYRDAPETGEARAEGSRLFQAFIDEALPLADKARRTLAADLILRTMSAVGSSYSSVPRSQEEIAGYASALADMLCGYVTAIRG
ncbi:TetR family transcriptional regulator [Novosphingobium terrae]|uniref:TetR family transcriptional regulator n=1 Tax=Novosphingobium terrae TaxID=2726189 RepID=UPI0019813217|nr:TetR family transcriptional regulator [Novosphingobium terrae]